MNEIGAGIQEVKDCRYCQRIINENLETWEVKAKKAQEKAKEAKYCEHFGVFNRNFYGENKELLYKWEPKNNGRHFYCTNKCCITADNGTRPDLVIYKVNRYGDEWQDSNHAFSKVKSTMGIDIQNIQCEQCRQQQVVEGNASLPSSNDKDSNDSPSFNGNCDKCKKKMQAETSITGPEKNIITFTGEAVHTIKNPRTGKEYHICPECSICPYCQAKTIEIMTDENNSKWKANVWLCKDCATNTNPREEDKKDNNLKPTTPYYNKNPWLVSEGESWWSSMGWIIRGLVGIFFIALPFILLFLIIRFLWNAGSKRK